MVGVQKRSHKQKFHPDNERRDTAGNAEEEDEKVTNIFYKSLEHGVGL